MLRVVVVVKGFLSSLDEGGISRLAERGCYERAAGSEEKAN
jgi:hypothetical protein